MSSEYILFDENEFEEDLSKEGGVIRNLLTDSFTIFYFMSIPQLSRLVNALLKPKFFEIIVDFYQNPENLKTLRDNIKRILKINESTISHHITNLSRSGLVKIEQKEVMFSVYGQILLDKILELRELLLKDGTKVSVKKYIINMLNPLKSIFKIFTIEALSTGSLGFSDLLDRVNLMLEISKNQIKRISDNQLSYHLQQLKESKVIKKENKLYLLTDSGLNIYKFVNIIALNFTKKKLEKKDLKKQSIKEFGYEPKERIISVTFKNVKGKELFEYCAKGIVIFVSDAGKYRGFFERNSCDRLIDRFRYLYERPRNFQKEISDSILKIRPIDENEIILLAITLMNLYNISALPILRDNEIVGFLDKINIIRAFFS
ncbi:MAG: hypothetical protein ACFE9S_16205 [Candidatus Hermodarchaeota archaeon]